MTPTVDGDLVPSVRPRRRLIRLTALGVTVGVAAAAIVGSTGADAAAAPKPQAQSVGNFLDATVGGMTLDAIAKLKYATAKAPGSTSVQNPLDATALNAIDLPLTGALQLPTIAGITLGAVNQVANAKTSGASYGASGAVQNSGGVSVGGSNSSYPANATIDLTAAGLTGNSPVPLPIGTGSATALGGLTATIGGVAALASTPKGYGKAGATTYQIANVDLNLGSPLLGKTLGAVTTQLQSGLDTIVTTLTSAIGALGTLPAGCKLTSPVALTKPISLEGGAVTLNASTATITISLGKLLTQLGLDLNTLPANTDLIDYLLAYLADPKGLAKGVQGLIDGLVDPLTAEFTACSAALNAIPVLGPILTGLVSTLTSGKTTIETTVSNLAGQLVGATGANPLAPVASALKNLIDIGVNVQPNGAKGTYTDPLAATPKQGTPVVEGQTIVRAIELNIAGAASGLGLGGGLPSLGGLGLPGLPSSFAQLKAARFAAPRQAAAAGTGIATLALANAAAGPSTAPTVAPPSSTTPAPPTTTVPTTSVPTGVPAGAAGHTGGGSPALPIVLVLMGLVLAGGGVTALRFRAKFSPGH